MLSSILDVLVTAGLLVVLVGMIFRGIRRFFRKFRG